MVEQLNILFSNSRISNGETVGQSWWKKKTSNGGKVEQMTVERQKRDGQKSKTSTGGTV